MKRPLILVGSALVGLAAGFAWRLLPSRMSATSAGAARISPTAPAKPARPAFTGASPLAEMAAADLSLTDGVTRWLHWMTAVEKAGPKDFPHLARLAQRLPGALPLLAARWIDRDPHGMFEACRHAEAIRSGFPAQELGEMLFTAWPKQDPDAVLAVLKDHPSMTFLWQSAALNALFQNRPEQALIALSELGIDAFGLREMSALDKWVAADPRHAAEVALAHPSGSLTDRVLEIAATEWTQRDPASALAFATAQPGGPAVDMASHVLRRWMERDGDRASAWFATTEGPWREFLLPTFIEAWGPQDPAGALQWCLAHTTGSLQSGVVANLVKGTLAHDPHAAAALVLQLEPSPLRTLAAVTFANTALNPWPWPPRPGETKASLPHQADTLDWLGRLDPPVRQTVLSQLATSWHERDPKGFLEFLHTPAGQDASPDTLAALARRLVRWQPLAAIEWASQLPETIRQRTLADTFQNWAASQPEAAETWLQQLPPDDPRRHACSPGLSSLEK